MKEQHRRRGVEILSSFRYIAGYILNYYALNEDEKVSRGNTLAENRRRRLHRPSCMDRWYKGPLCVQRRVPSRWQISALTLAAAASVVRVVYIRGNNLLLALAHDKRGSLIS